MAESGGEGEALRELYVRFDARVEGADELDRLDEAADRAKNSVQEAGEHAEHAEGLFHHLGEALEGVAAVFAGSELLKGIRETTQELESLSHLSEQTGIAAEKLEFYGFVVGQVGGDVSDFRSNLSALQRALSQTESGVAPQTAALKKLGIETAGLKDGSEDMNTILPKIFENFGRLKSPAEEAAVAQRLFGRSGLALLPVLRQGAKGFEEYRAKFEATGGAAPEEAIERAKEYEKSIKLMNAAFGDLKTHLVTGVLPALTHATEWVTDFTAGLSHFLKGTTASEHAIFGLAAAFAGPLLGALKPFLGPGLKFLGIYAAVDDLLAFLEGKDSLIGRLLDAAFGYGTAEAARAWAIDAKNAFLDFKASASATYAALDSDQSSFTEKAIASFIAFVRDASQGFPAMGAAFDSELAGMLASLISFVADALDHWNELVKGFKIPPTLKVLAGLATGGAAVPVLEAAEKAAGGATVDTGGLRDTAGTLRQRQQDRAQDALLSTAGLKAPPGSTQAEKTALLGEARQKGAGERTAATLTGEQAKQAQGAEQFATLGAAHAAGVTANYTDNKKIDLHFQQGASEDFKRMVKSAVAEALKDDNRTALQQITQRGTK